MISLGESSGRLEEVLGTLSGLYHREASEQAARIKVLIEPLLIALSGVIVGTLLLAVYLPIFELGGVPDS
jgi:type IV pilus assembly protein PilC